MADWRILFPVEGPSDLSGGDAKLPGNDRWLHASFQSRPDCIHLGLRERRTWDLLADAPEFFFPFLRPSAATFGIDRL
jgi:hypothetical protein